MSVYQLKLFGMTCVDFYFKLIPIFILFSRSSQKRSHFGLRVAAVIPALLLLCRALVQLPVFRVFDMYMFLIYILLFAGFWSGNSCTMPQLTASCSTSWAGMP